MRIWHQNLIPKLCRQHLLACWREGLGAYKIITENKKGYRNHPAVKEFEKHHNILWIRLAVIRKEMLTRGWKPKEPPPKPLLQNSNTFKSYYRKQWQGLKQQIEVLKSKKCDCKI